MKFKIGDRVCWQSQAGGNYTTKCGLVVYVLAPKDNPVDIAAKRFQGHQRMFGGMFPPPGNDGAYLVEVAGGKTAKARSRLYMPNPKKLELVR